MLPAVCHQNVTFRPPSPDPFPHGALVDELIEPTPESSPTTSRLDFARRLEETVSLARELRSRLKHGPWKRTRIRARRQLRKLAHRLDELQRNILAGNGPADLRVLEDGVGDIDATIRNSLYNTPAKAELKGLARSLRDRRRTIG